MTPTMRRALAFAGLSILLLVPCFWQPRIQAGDLASHTYNAWLAQLIERGQAPGLSLAPQTNNVLFDLMLSGLMPVWGASAAQRIAVSLAVLVFFWGAFAFVWSSTRTGSRQLPWRLAPCIAMLAYGWVFRMGFFNFYISLGLCLGAMALVRQKSRRLAVAAVPLFAIAYVAHALPVVWAVSILSYAWVARSIAPRHRFKLMVGALACLILAGFLLGAFFPTRRGNDQLIAVTGADQFWIYGKAYIAIGAAILVSWTACLLLAFQFRGVQRTVMDPRFQVCAIGAAALILLPGGVLLPGFRSALDFIAERMSLAGAILFLGLIGSVRLPRPLIGAMAAIALAFFALSYRDERALNRVESQIDRLVTQLPPGQRVVSALEDPESRVRSMVHLIDRACIGKCFSYANYEPCTRQFRVRAEHQNPIVVSNYGDSWDIQTGGYIVKPSDLPLYRIDLCGPHDKGLCMVSLDAGDKLRNTGLDMAKLHLTEDSSHD